MATFFLVTALLQLGAAAFVQLRERDRRGQLLIAAGNIALIVLWAASRSVGVAGAGHGGGPEPVGLLDVLAVAAEAAAVLGLVARPASGARTSPTAAWPALALTALLVGGASLRWAPTTHADHAHRSPSSPAEAPEHGAVETVETVGTVVPADALEAVAHHPHGHGEGTHDHGERTQDHGDP
ncbi:MAG TPA: hypothetical protein VG078_06765 [Acidimicrobiales bacterium]|nr:hypothetical protein [Acidimicrobiales bacterium]